MQSHPTRGAATSPKTSRTTRTTPCLRRLLPSRHSDCSCLTWRPGSGAVFTVAGVGPERLSSL
eukprot:1688711-Alexandrium_andersonii.AAC.1